MECPPRDASPSQNSLNIYCLFNHPTVSPTILRPKIPHTPNKYNFSFTYPIPDEYIQAFLNQFNEVNRLNIFQLMNPL